MTLKMRKRQQKTYQQHTAVYSINLIGGLLILNNVTQTKHTQHIQPVTD